jgi:hypothetical protein
MIALFSALLGFASAAFPEFIKLFRDQKDRQHEITLLKLQMEYDREKLAAQRENEVGLRNVRLQEIQLAADTAEQMALNARIQPVHVPWVDALAGSVRPVITYLFFALYALIKLAQFQVLVAPSLPWVAALTPAQAMLAIWNEDDMALFTAIIAFWFGQRSLIKFRRA